MEDPYSFSFKTIAVDTDEDGINDDEDTDDDDDGIPDDYDSFPLDPAAAIDGDGDGYPDRWNEGMGEKNSWTGLSLDLYPNDADRWEAAGGGDGEARLPGGADDAPGQGHGVRAGAAVRAEQGLDADGVEGLRLRRRGAQRGAAAGTVAAVRGGVAGARRVGGDVQRHPVVAAARIPVTVTALVGAVDGEEPSQPAQRVPRREPIDCPDLEAAKGLRISAARVR